MKRIWKPLDVRGMRLFRVMRTIRWKGRKFEYDTFLVMSQSPSAAANLLQGTYPKEDWDPSIIDISYIGHAVNIYMPEAWWMKGASDKQRRGDRVGYGGLLENGRAIDAPRVRIPPPPQKEDN